MRQDDALVVQECPLERQHYETKLRKGTQTNLFASPCSFDILPTSDVQFRTTRPDEKEFLRLALPYIRVAHRVNWALETDISEHVMISKTNKRTFEDSSSSYLAPLPISLFMTHISSPFSFARRSRPKMEVLVWGRVPVVWLAGGMYAAENVRRAK